MLRYWKLASTLLVLSLGLAACPGPEEGGTPSLILTTNPRKVDANGQSATISVTATDAQGAPGTGTVTLKAKAGRFEGDAAELTLPLADGKASATYSCDIAVDSRCSGFVLIDGLWNETPGSTSIQVGSSTGGNTDGGTDGGTGGNDGGTDGGTGNNAKFNISLQFSKPLLVGNTGDQLDVTATVLRAQDNTPVPADTPVTFTTDLGSFTPTAGVQSVTANTTAAGKATVTLHVANEPPGTANLSATVEDESVEGTMTFSSISTIIYVSTTATRSMLGLESSGRETTTPITFKVLNASMQPVPGVEVSFEVSGAAGASVTPTAVTDAQGQATTTLRSGNTVGVAIVKAIVSATRQSVPDVSANHPGTPIVGGKPSDRGLTVDCVSKNLGALHATPPPRKGVTTNCTAKLVDRFGNPVGLSTPVQWYPEAGSISSPVNSKAQTGSTPSSSTGEATTIFNTDGIFPPYPVTPLPGEKYDGDPSVPSHANPRDMAVTVIAVVAGEEEFTDGSGPDQTSNGRWDKGEYFVDLGEPLVDRNDNGVWDPGEDFIDTERIDCANPSAPPTRNGKWDGPNGCWDGNTQIWRAIHLVYTGPLDLNHFSIPSLPATGEFFVSLNSTIDVGFIWGDAYYNRMSPNNANFTVSRSGTRGNATLTSNGGANAFDYGGFNIDYNTRMATTQPDGSLQIGELCDTGVPLPADSYQTVPVKVRCVRTVDFNFIGVANGNTGIVRLTGATNATGGPASSTVEIKPTHSFSVSSSATFPVTYE